MPSGRKHCYGRQMTCPPSLGHRVFDFDKEHEEDQFDTAFSARFLSRHEAQSRSGAWPRAIRAHQFRQRVV